MVNDNLDLNKASNILSRKDIPYSQELWRKSIHLVSLSIPIIYSFVSKEFALSILIPLTILFIIMEFSIRKFKLAKKVIYKYFGKIMRPHETSKEFVFNGATWVLISACCCIIVFPKILAVTGFTILIISDISAALYGRKFGKTRFIDKSLQGTSAFIISAWIIILIIGFLNEAPISYLISGFIASVLAGIVEASSKRMKVDDNLTVPVTVGIVMWIASYIAAIYFHLGFLYLM